MPKLSKKQVVELITSRLSKCSDLQHKAFMDLSKLYVELTRPSKQSQYRSRVKTVNVIQKEAQKAIKEVKKVTESAKVKPVALLPAPSMDELVVQLEKQNKEQS